MTKDEKNAYARAYYKKNRDKLRAYHNKYTKDNKEELREKNREWYENTNKEHKRAYRKKWYQENKNRVAAKTRENKLKRIYGLTEAEYSALAKMQGDLCAVCNLQQPKGEKLRIDHCHKTGQVRGLLCHKCNCGIGMLQDDANLVQSALNYLKKSQDG